MIVQTKGDRRKLTSDELRILDSEVLPTARRWLRQFPLLAEYAVGSLTYWDEPIVDDRGKPYVPHDAFDVDGNKRESK